MSFDVPPLVIHVILCGIVLAQRVGGGDFIWLLWKLCVPVVPKYFSTESLGPGNKFGGFRYYHQSKK